MASVQAAIDLVVRGSNAVNRLIQDINQLQGAVDRVNSRTLDIASDTLNRRVQEITRGLRGIGTAADPRPEVARRVEQITRQQARATNDLATAQDRLTRANTAAARAEEQLIERSQRRTRSDSQVQRNIENSLNRSRAAASAATDQIGQLGARLRSLGRELAAIQRTSAEAAIPQIRGLIDVNQILSTQRTIRVLAEEFNRLGDSARISSEERRASNTDLPNQIRQFSRLSDQLAESRVRAQTLRQELAAIGRNEALRQIPAIEFSVEGDVDQIRAEMIRMTQVQEEITEASRENARILERNQQRQAQRSELRTQLREENNLINQLETEAVEAGQAVIRLQERLADLAEFRYRDQPRTGLEVSLNQIQAQAESLALVANNSSIASNEFRQFTVAAEVASIKLARAQQQSFSALAAGFSTTGGIQIPEGLRMPETVAGARGLVSEVLAEMPTVATGASSAALAGYINMLESLRRLVPLLGDEFRALGEGIARANEEMARGMAPAGISPQIQAALSQMEGQRIDPFGFSDQQLNEQLNQRAEAYVKQREEISRLQAVLEGMGGKKYDPFNISDEQINAALNERASLYQAQTAEISRLMGVLSSMEGRRVDPFGISDDQINNSLNDRAEEYVKQQNELSDLQRILSSMEGKKYDPLNISDEQINQGLNERAVQYQIQRQELTSLQGVLAAMEGKRVDPLGISDEQINSALNQRADAYVRQVEELKELESVLAAMHGRNYDPFNITDQQINAGLEERATAYIKQREELLSLQGVLEGMQSKRYDPLGITDSQINAGLNERAAAYERQIADIARLQASLRGMEGRAIDPFNIGDDQINASLNERASLYVKQLEEISQLQAVLERMEGKKYDPLNVTDSQINAALNERASLYVKQREELESLQQVLGRMEGRRFDPLGISDEQINQALNARRVPGFISTFQGFQGSLEESRGFFGAQNPAQAIDRIVREFTGAAADPDNLLGLSAIGKAAKSSTKDLEILSAGLKDIYTNLDPAAEGFERLNRELRQTTARLDDIVASRAPDADPLVRLTRSPRLAQGISEGLIGGAFPLLFGQGAGAAVGGGLGGFAGGFAGGALGFGLSLIGTAVGTAVDTFVNNMKELGKSLKDPTAALTAMETAGLRVTPQLQDTVERLQSLGLAAAAQAVVFSELEAQLGKDGAAQIRALTAEQKKLDEAMQDMNATIMSMLLPSVTGAVSIINDLAAAIKFLAEVEPPGWVKNLGGAAFNVASVVNPGFALSRFQFEEARKRGRQSAEEAAQKPLELTPELRRQQELALPRATLEALNVQLDNGAKQFTDQVRAAAREQQDLDLQRRDLIESYERSIGDLRLTIERQVIQERLANAGRENEILAAQGEVRLQQLRNANAELTRSLSGNEFGQQLADAVSQFTEQQLSTENEIANRRRNLELELETKRIQTEQYRADIAKQIEQLNLSTAKQVASIQLSVARKNEDYDRKRFQLEKQIAVMNLNVSRIETEQKIAGLDLQVQAITDPALRQNVFNTIDKYRDIIKQRDSQIQKINAAQPPAPISFSVPALGASVSTSGIDKVVAKGAQLARQLESIRTQLNTLVSEGNFNEFNDRLKNLADQGVQALTSEYEDLLAAMSADPTAAADKRINDAMKAVTEGRGIQGSPLRKELIELVGLYGDLAKQNIELARTYEFLTSRLSSQLDQIEELKEQFNTLTVGNTEYEKTLIALTQRGVNPASEGFSKLIENAKEIDRLNQKIEVINAFRTAATELTGSMRSLVEQFFELGSASEAVKRVSDELGKKAFGFILDIAFKPVENAMQKTMFDLADKLGFDIKPESLKQLQEVTTIRQNVEIIANSIAPLVEKLKSLQPIVPGLTSGSASGGNLLTPSLPFSAQTSINSQDLINQINNEIGPRLFAKIDADIQGYYDKIISMHALNPPTAERRIADVDKLIQTRTNLLDGLAGAFSNLVSRLDTNTPGAPELVDALNKKINEMRLKYEKKAEDIFRGEVVAPTGPQSSLPLSMMNGIGGPDLPRQAFPLNSNVPYPNADLLTPGKPTLNKAEQDAANNIRPLANEIQVMGTAAAQARDPLMEVINQFPPFGKATADVAATTNQSSNKIAGIVPQWGKSLGAVVTGLGLASSAIVSIVGGVGLIKKGGAGNVLSGIGSILTTIGGIGMSAAGFMKSGPVSPTAAGGDVWGAVGRAIGSANGNIFDDGKLMRFANGGILQSPTLFSFEDAGVTKTGQAGEAGVEAVMPLKRTKDGRLGVEADLSIPFENDGQFEAEDGESGEGAGTSQGPMVPFLRAGGRTGSMTATQMLQAAAEAGLSVPFMKDSATTTPDLASLDSPIRFETFQIGKLDVVTRGEAEEIGRRAEARGAAKGAALAQKKTQNSPTTRRRSGLPI